MLLNLHTHLEGTVRPETAAELAAEIGLPAPMGGWENAFRIKGRGNLTVFLSHVAAAYPVLGRAENLRRVAFEAVQDAALDGQSYVEIRLGPGTHARPNLSVLKVLAAVCEGVTEARAVTGIHAGVIACMLRHEPQDLVEEIARAAVRLAGKGIVGLDVAGDEFLYPSLDRFAPLYALARDAGLGLTAHAAEAGTAYSAREAVQSLGVRRIGHGSHIVDDGKVLDWFCHEGVTIEVCATSNVLTGAAPSLSEHPVHAFVAAGIAVVLGDDNPENTGVRLSEEARLLATAGLGAEVVAGFARNAIDAAFCSDRVRMDLQTLLDLEVIASSS